MKLLTLMAMLTGGSLGCGTILNSGVATVTLPAGASLDGYVISSMQSLQINKQVPHEITFADGRRCVIESNVSVGYVLADVFLGFFGLGILVDGITQDWRTLDSDYCVGVTVE